MDDISKLGICQFIKRNINYETFDISLQRLLKQTRPIRFQDVSADFWIIIIRTQHSQIHLHHSISMSRQRFVDQSSGNMLHSAIMI